MNDDTYAPIDKEMTISLTYLRIAHGEILSQVLENGLHPHNPLRSAVTPWH